MLGVFKCLQKVPRDFAGLAREPRVERGLSAARLIPAKIAIVPYALQDIGHSESDAWKELINEAGDEQRDARAHEALEGDGEHCSATPRRFGALRVVQCKMILNGESVSNTR